MKFDTKRYGASVENLPEVSAFVEECADRFDLDDRKKFGLLLALEEAFVNICSHAYPDGAGEAGITCTGDGDDFVLEIADRGTAFDVLSLPDPDITLDVVDRQVGGLGIHFIRTLTDSVSYHREKDQNILRMTFKRRHMGLKDLALTEQCDDGR